MRTEFSYSVLARLVLPSEAWAVEDLHNERGTIGAIISESLVWVEFGESLRLDENETVGEKRLSLVAYRGQEALEFQGLKASEGDPISSHADVANPGKDRCSLHCLQWQPFPFKDSRAWCCFLSRMLFKRHLVAPCFRELRLTG